MGLLLKHTVGSLPAFLFCSDIFSWGAMGSGPVKGFVSPEVQEIVTKKHDPAMNKIAKEDGESATFAAGCFWGVQLAFQVWQAPTTLLLHPYPAPPPPESARGG